MDHFTFHAEVTDDLFEPTGGLLENILGDDRSLRQRRLRQELEAGKLVFGLLA